jgi:hypothetical protein
MSESGMEPPETPSGAIGDERQEELLEDAEPYRVPEEAEEKDESVGEEGTVVERRPWWRFWG